MIPIGKKGIILAGNTKFIGWEIFVQDDTKDSTGGYYILYSKDNEGYDAWVENKECVEHHFRSRHFIVKWED